MNSTIRKYPPISLIEMEYASGRARGPAVIRQLIERVKVLESQLANTIPFLNVQHPEVEKLKADCDAVLGTPYHLIVIDEKIRDYEDKGGCGNCVTSIGRVS